jgi:hypothetical protein
MGICYVGNLFYLPIYLQSIQGRSALPTAGMLLALTIPAGLVAFVCEELVAWFSERMLPWFLTGGFLLWVIGSVLKITFDRTTTEYPIASVLITESIGIGCTLQMSLVAIQSYTSPADRTAATGLHSFIRVVGGAFGLVISGVILSNQLRYKLASLPFANRHMIEELTSSVYKLKDSGLSEEDMDLVLTAYMKGLKLVFMFFVILTSINLGLCFYLTFHTRCARPQASDAGSTDTAVEVTAEPAP